MDALGRTLNTVADSVSKVGKAHDDQLLAFTDACQAMLPYYDPGLDEPSRRPWFRSLDAMAMEELKLKALTGESYGHHMDLVNGYPYARAGSKNFGEEKRAVTFMATLCDGAGCVEVNLQTQLASIWSCAGLSSRPAELPYSRFEL